MATRGDIHSPAVIQPANYTFIGFRIPRWSYSYDSRATGLWLREGARVKTHMAQTGGSWATHDHGGTCMICGAHAVYLAVYHHKPTNEYIQCGMDCTEKMDIADPLSFRKLRDAVQAAQKARAGWKKAEGYLLTQGLTRVWHVYIDCMKPDATTLEGSLRLAGMEGDQDALKVLRDLWLDEGLDPDAQPVPTGKEERTIIDIVTRLARYGYLSTAQIDYLHKLIKQIEDRPVRLAKQAELEAKRAEEKSKAQDVPTGRCTLLVEVLKTEYKEYSGFSGGRNVMTVKAVNEGFVLWGTVPSGCGNVKKGDHIELTATLEQSSKDTKFGFIKRPYGRIVEEVVSS